MTGTQVFDMALHIAGYDSTVHNAAAAALRRRAFGAINTVYAELFRMEYPDREFTPLQRLEDALTLSAHTCCFVMPYGIVAVLCDADGNAADGTRFAALYNRRRTTVRPAEPCRRKDCLPKGRLL